MTIDSYLQNPCRAASIPYWKSQIVPIPDFMRILHEEDFQEDFLEHYDDDRYFRLKHSLQDVPACTLPEQFAFSTAMISEFVQHINTCYPNQNMTVEELQAYSTHPVYCPELWLVIRDTQTGRIAASGIGELDAEVGEGVLEWIQVSPDERRRGLGTCIVLELLRRMQGRAAFATVSGRCQNQDNPEALYRTCGFIGDDIWHILRKK